MVAPYHGPGGYSLNPPLWTVAVMATTDLLSPEYLEHYAKICAEFSRREQIILQLISEGWSNRHICKALSYSRNTISGMLTHIYEAFNLTGFNGPVYSNRTRAAYLWHLYKHREDLP